ncbi:hypothetical protein SteCoe_3419 [Stentor coeruleus]|uniref:Uncharacterized protein n=1 Tax=Stentor coeruleus TaxID=5963 RepID=A0A1R2CX57_9CILI|nr:hypothetical protein SteCoe_3419 [Stentor coeruleus]
MNRKLTSRLSRPASITARSKPMPLIAKGVGGSTSSLAPKPIKISKGPPSSRVFQSIKKYQIVPTNFRKFYERGDLPVVVNFSGANRKIVWKVDPDVLDLHHYLPMFFEGLREIDEPYKFLAERSIDDLLEKCSHKVLPVLPQLIIPIKMALSTKIPEVIVITIKKLQKLIKCGNSIGEALVPYYRQILPIFNMFKGKRANLGDMIDYSQYKGINISELIHETLEIMETYGGDDAYINIKYMIPTYESCMF